MTTCDLLAAATAGVRREVLGPDFDTASTLIGVRELGSPYRGCKALVEIKRVAAARAASQ